MIGITDENLDIKFDGNIKIELESNIFRTLDGKIINNQPNQKKLIIDISFYSEYLFTLEVGKIYNIFLDNNFFIQSKKTTLQLPYAISDVFFYNDDKLINRNKYFEKNQIINLDKSNNLISIIYKPILDCVLINYTYDNNLNVLRFEYTSFYEFLNINKKN